ncbi:hypothetical protein [Catelliglobosispora koreensis]|uniref:hypothetical protein n=1 Tax=Catelliglobosispora koreensis TaxID=129052 RepID=UPI0003A5A6E9|nr:hypothetical protein [Catelliglobosispora koreensis]
MPAAIRRMKNLAILELVNIPLWMVAWFGILDFPATTANAAGFAAFALLLVQGSAYWMLKIRQLRARLARLPFIGVFRVLRIANIPLLLTALAVSLLGEPGRGSYLGVGLALFAVLEHINYFHVQLMHDTRADLRRLFSTGLRRSHLARDLLASKGS